MMSYRQSYLYWIRMYPALSRNSKLQKRIWKKIRAEIKSIVSGYIIQTKNYQRPDPRWKHSGILQNAMMAMATASVVLWSRKRTIRALSELLLI